MSPDLSLTDKHTIETPEQTRLEFSVAGIGSRFIALAIDTLIQAGIAVVLVIVIAVFGLMGALRSIPQGGVWALALLVGMMFLVYFGYFAIFEVIWNGQTPGKRRAGIRVVKDSGRPLSPSETIGRNLLRLVDQLPGFYAIGIVVSLLNSRNKRLGDFVAGSIVVREGSLAAIRPVWEAGHTLGAPAAPRIGANGLTAEEFSLIDAFLNRRSELPADVRSRMAREVLGRVRPKVSAGAEREMSTESILESLAQEYRSMRGYL